MARRHPHEAGETLGEIQSLADHLAEWLRAHWKIPAGALVAALVLTGALTALRAWRDHREITAAGAVAAADREFLTAMGAQPGASSFEEPANPETGKKARREGADRLLEVARRHAGTAAALQAQIEAATLLAQTGNGDKAIELWREVLATGKAGPELTALVQVRIAQADEADGRWSEAAKAYQEAGEQRAYPLWAWALADAARCLVEAGDRDQAVRIAERLRTDAPAIELPPHLTALLDDLRATAPTAPQS